MYADNHGSTLTDVMSSLQIIRNKFLEVTYIEKYILTH